MNLFSSLILVFYDAMCAGRLLIRAFMHKQLSLIYYLHVNYRNRAHTLARIDSLPLPPHIYIMQLKEK